MEFLTLTELLVGIAVTIFMFWFWSRWDIFKFSFTYPCRVFGLPPLGAFIYIGNLREMLPFLQRQFQRCGERTACIWLSLTPFLFTADPKVVEQILTLPEFVDKSTIVYGPVRDVLKGGLVAAKPQRAIELRKYFAPAFRHKNLLGLLPLMNSRSKQFVKQLDGAFCKLDGDTPNLLHALHVFTLGMSKRTVMGYTKNEDTEDFTTIMKRLQFTFRHILYEMTLNCIHLRKLIQYNPVFANVRNKLNEFGHEILTHRVEFLASLNNEKTHKDINSNETKGKEPFLFIDQAIKFYRSGQLNWMDVVSESNGLLVASYETTSSTLFSSLLLLAIHTDVQERLYDEIATVFPPHKRNDEIFVDYGSLHQLQYLDMVVNEVLRLLPAVPMIARQAAGDGGVLNINGHGHKLPKHMQLIIDIYHLHRDVNVWGEDADKFNPDHFLPQNVADRSAYAFIPFSKGPRNCMGWAYAYFVIKVLLVHVLRTYKLHTDLKYENINVNLSIFLEHNSSACLQLQRRTETAL